MSVIGKLRRGWGGAIILVLGFIQGFPDYSCIFSAKPHYDYSRISSRWRTPHHHHLLKYLPWQVQKASMFPQLLPCKPETFLFKNFELIFCYKTCCAQKSLSQGMTRAHIIAYNFSDRQLAWNMDHKREEGLLLLLPIPTDWNSRQRIDAHQCLLNKRLSWWVKPISIMLLCFCFFPQKHLKIIFLTRF